MGEAPQRAAGPANPAQKVQAQRAGRVHAGAVPASRASAICRWLSGAWGRGRGQMHSSGGRRAPPTVAEQDAQHWRGRPLRGAPALEPSVIRAWGAGRYGERRPSHRLRPPALGNKYWGRTCLQLWPGPQTAARASSPPEATRVTTALTTAALTTAMWPHVAPGRRVTWRTHMAGSHGRHHLQMALMHGV